MPPVHAQLGKVTLNLPRYQLAQQEEDHVPSHRIPGPQGKHSSGRGIARHPIAAAGGNELGVMPPGSGVNVHFGLAVEAPLRVEAAPPIQELEPNGPTQRLPERQGEILLLRGWKSLKFGVKSPRV